MPAKTTLQFVDWGASSRVCCTAADAAGNIYVAGYVLEPDPAANGQSRFVGKAAVTKFDSENRVVYTFFVRGRHTPSALAVNRQGEVFLAGRTDGAFPTVNPLPAPAISFSENAFLSKLDASGTTLLFSTLIGRSEIHAIALDAGGNVVIAGSTSASDFPVTPDAYQLSGPVGDGFGTPRYAVVARISSDGRRWMHSTFLGDRHTTCSGGSVCIGKYGNTAARSIAVDSDGAILIAGGTNTDRFPTTDGAFQRTARFSGGQPSVALPVGFVTRFKPDLGALDWSTYFGNANLPALASDSIEDFGLATDGSVFIAGLAASRDFPVTEGSFSTTRPNTDAFNQRSAYAARFTSSGSLVFATYLAGPVDANSGIGLNAASPDRAQITFQTPPAQGPFTGRPGRAVLFELASDGRRALRIQELPAGTTGGGLVRDSSGRTVLGGATTGSILRIRPGQSTPAVFGQANIAWQETSSHVAPGEIVRVYGASLAGPDLQVRLSDTSAPLLHAAEDHIDAIVPFGVASRTSVSFDVITTAGRSNPVELLVAPAAPEIIGNEDGTAAALNEDGSVNSSSNPAAPGSIVALYVNGAGLFEPEVPDGTIASGPSPQLALPVTASCDAKPVDVVYAGAAPGIVAGVSQVNIRLDRDPAAARSCSVSVAGRTSHPRRISVQR